ncbi:MAG: methyl-accepting chemotaxis protein [Rhodocyclaceae bacterium]|nr:methyl-accepting chemotaxis protein [Rhodocyclaceae bacterium]
MKNENKGFGDLPIAGKLNIVLIAAIAVILSLAGFFQSHWLAKKIEERSLADLQRTNRQVVDMIDAYASVLERSAEMLGGQFAAGLPRHFSVDGARPVPTASGSFPTLRGGDTVFNNNFAVVDSFTAATGGIATVFVRQGEDFFRVATSLKKENGERALGTPLGAKHPAFSALMAGNPYTGRATLFGRDYMTRYVPLKDAAGQVVGVSFIGIDFTESLMALKKKVLGIKVGETGYVFALDAVKDPGMAIIHPAAEGKSLIGAKDTNGRLFVKEMMDMKHGILRYDWANPERGEKTPREKVTVIDHFDKWGWVVGTGSYLEEFTRDVRGVQIQFAISALLVAVALVAVVFLSTRRWVSRPLGEALAVTNRVAAGDLTVSVAVTNRDEVGQLLTATNEMCVQLRAMIGEVNAGIGSLANGVGKLASASHEVATSSGAQSDAAASMAAAVEEMTASMDRVFEHAQEAREMAESSGAVSASGAAVIDAAIREMTSIAATVRDSSTAVAQLGDQSQQITNIVNVIREIADQTNLLALNAAIEAARAGEQGRGFAVVADEVRKLAERTTQSTQEIAAMVGQIQAGAKNAVDSMNVGVSQVEDGVNLANKAGDSIADIKIGAAHVGEAVIGISDALREQTAASQDIARNVERIAQQAEHNHSQAFQTSGAATDMEQLAERLRQSIARFRT